MHQTVLKKTRHLERLIRKNKQIKANLNVQEEFENFEMKLMEQLRNMKNSIIAKAKSFKNVLHVTTNLCPSYSSRTIRKVFEFLRKGVFFLQEIVIGQFSIHAEANNIIHNPEIKHIK